MKANITRKEGKFIKAYFEGKPLYECAKYAGSKAKDKQSLSNVGYIMLKKLDISMEETLDRIGCTDEALAQTLQDGRLANKRYYGTYQGTIIASEPVPDYQARLKSVELAGRFKGKFIDRTELTGKDGGDIIFQLASKRNKKATLNIDDP